MIRDFSHVARKAQIGQSFKSMTGENAMKAGGGFKVRNTVGLLMEEIRLTS